MLLIKHYKLILFFLIFPVYLWAQQGKDYIKGKVTEKTKDRKDMPLIGANVYWLGTTIGATTNTDGIFEIEKVSETSMLIISYVGYNNDTIDTKNKDYINVKLNTITLDEVEIVHRKKSMEISYLDPLKTEKISEKELLKAACCNLSESFETNPSVDVSFTDAVTGTRQIQMLGLAGVYTQITCENIPDVRGLSAIYGLTYVPGPWVESIQLNKGAGSVANGFESITGQINVNLRNPANMDRLYINLFGNESGRMEINANLRADTDNNWGTALLLHGKSSNIKHDRNDDGFMDHPLSKQFIGLNRWELYNDKGLHLQFGAKGTYIDNIGGQTGFNLDIDQDDENIWGMYLLMERMEAWSKIGKVNLEEPWKSFGIQLSGAIHNQESFFGLTNYEAKQSTFYGNLIFQGIIGNTNHKRKIGFSLQYDDYTEKLNTTNFDRTEIVPGTFFEYTYTHLENFNVVAGLRADYHNHYGIFITPRLHLRYALKENTVIRASGGRGQRTANILAENSGLMAGSRNIIIDGDGSSKPFGLNPEIAWNFGVNLTQTFRLDYRDGSISFDLYRTIFENQIVIDLDQSPQQSIFYNLEGESWSNSFQAQIDYELIKRLDARLAYRWYDVQNTYNGNLMKKPLVASHRAFLNLAYETRNHWKFDYTINWIGKKRIPSTTSNPEEYQLPDYSPDFILMNAQISKTWLEKFEFYIGGENLLNFKQKNAILASERPFSQYFDSSLIWGPIFGRKIYFGLRYRLK